MKLVKCTKPKGKLVPIDTPLNVRGELFQTYRRDAEGDGDGDQYSEYFEHNQTRDKWMRMEKEAA